MKFYVDKSVWGGIVDNEFSLWTVPFFEQVRNGIYKIPGIITYLLRLSVIVAF